MGPASHHARSGPAARRRPGAEVLVRAAAGDVDLAAAAAVHAAVLGGDGEQWQERIARTRARRGGLLAVAVVAGAVVGCGKAAWYEPVGPDDAAPAGRYLAGLVVEPMWRRCGAGDALTRWRLQRTHADGEAAWMVTNARNRASLALHLALGFVEVGRAASYLGEPFDGGTGVLLRADPPA